ncbi:GNAT family N-acetyltransferase [Marimonas lutisalis]|uniref:GNAT family N-acetyltransferase n=1 Tax=Marimonas lutisalis TaxID=2545756 RepID=UPI001F1F1B6D|nr:GNAT family N-acetyltransferase [Marimonas lutisalis]
MPVTLRTPMPADLAALSALCLRSKGHWGYDAAFLAACRDELTLTPDDLATTALIMAETAGTPVGLAQVDLRADPAELLKLFVDPPRIGTGLGRRLFDWSAQTARARGARALRIEADPGALPFYRAMGARCVGDAPSGSIRGRRLPLLMLTL